jgi:Kef-type K+ transport system membrane component KefB
MNPLPHVLLALAAVIVAARLLGALFARLGQPAVIGEVVAGIALGPSLLGRAWPEAMQFLLPEAAMPYLGVIAQLGVVLYMLLVGLELDAALLRRQAGTATLVSCASLAVPFGLGVLLAGPLFPDLAPEGVGFTPFALFLGAALAVTAFPVLARILTDRGMSRAPLGVLALGCAAAADLLAWCLLAVVVGVAQAQVHSALAVLGLTCLFVVALLWVVRPAVVWLVRRQEGRPVEAGAVAWVLAGVLLSALATEAIGIHAVFGAFLLGVVFPHDSALARELERRLHSGIVLMLLPAFFAFTGMRTQIGLIQGAEDWLLCLAITAVATAGKVGGTALAARLAGLGWRSATALGVLMNTRGLMELIVLNVGLDLGVIAPRLFAMMVLMALATTLATVPLLRVLHPSAELLAPTGANPDTPSPQSSLVKCSSNPPA